jgi:hypothetical protein
LKSIKIETSMIDSKFTYSAVVVDRTAYLNWRQNTLKADFTVGLQCWIASFPAEAI